MLKHRVLPILLLAGNRLVKTAGFKKPVYVGDPINAVKIFNDKEVDELILVDIDATKHGSPPNFSLIEKVASECFMPLTYGGGIRDLDDARTLFSLGVEKVSLQHALYSTPHLVRDVSARYGRQSVVFALDVVRKPFGRLAVRMAPRSTRVNSDVTSLVARAQELGVGEILLTSVNREGSFRGPDLDLIRLVASAAQIPVIANGGVSSIDDMRKMISAGASAVAAGAFFVFSGPHRAVLLTYPNYLDLEFLLGNED